MRVRRFRPWRLQWSVKGIDEGLRQELGGLPGVYCLGDERQCSVQAVPGTCWVMAFLAPNALKLSFMGVEVVARDVRGVTRFTRAQ